MKDLVQVIKRAVRIFFQNPVAFFSLQTPMLLLVLIDFFTVDWMEDHLPVWGLFSFVIFGMGWTVCSALTFVAVEQRRNRMPGTLASTLPQVTPRLGTLLVAGFCANLVTFLGFLALVIPGVWAIVSYVYVPIVVMVAPSQTVRVTLRESSERVKEKGFWFFLAMTASYFVLVAAVTWLLKKVGIGALHMSGHGMPLLVVTTLISSTLAAWFDIALANLFLDRGEAAEPSFVIANPEG